MIWMSKVEKHTEASKSLLQFACSRLTRCLRKTTQTCQALSTNCLTQKELFLFVSQGTRKKLEWQR